MKNSLLNEHQRTAVLLPDEAIHKFAKSGLGSKRNSSVHEKLFKSGIGSIRKKTLKQITAKKERERKELSFMPETNTHMRMESRRRSQKDFLDDMKSFSDQKNAKLYSQIQKKRLDERKSMNSHFKRRKSQSPDFTKLNKLYKKGVKKQIERNQSVMNTLRSLDRYFPSHSYLYV